MQAVTEIYELRPDTPQDCAELTDEHIARYEESWRLLVHGKWSDAYELLHGLPAADRPKDVLLSLILKHNRIAPPNWDGVINFPFLQ
jgi:adenylate cyclase